MSKANMIQLDDYVDSNGSGRSANQIFAEHRNCETAHILISDRLVQLKLVRSFAKAQQHQAVDHK